MILAAENLCLPGRMDGISARFQPGEVTAICGPNGAGKSSLLAALAGLLTPTAGRVALGGEHLTSMPPHSRARAIGYLAQTAQVAWDVSVEVLVSLGRIPFQWTGGSTPGEDAAAIGSAISAMDLLPLRHRRVSRLSGGERARVLLARVLAGQPGWILADEPLANLDLAHAGALIACLRQQALAGSGVVLVLHDLASAMNHADRVLVLDKGSIVADGPPELALTEAIISCVWGVSARWLGEAGGRALSVGQG